MKARSIFSARYFHIYMILPLVALLIAIFGYPFARAIWLSFFEASFGRTRPAEFVGFGNYVAILTSDVFRASIARTFVWAFWNLVVQLSIPLGIALLLNRHLRGINAARALMLLPWIIPTVPVAVVLRLVLLPRIGIISELSNLLGFGYLHFLGHPLLAMPVLIIVNSWQFIPFGTLLILSALQTVPATLYDAAHVDGCGPWQRFKHVTFPIIGSMIWFVGFLAFAWNFNTFDLIQLTTEGGPGRLTETLPVLIYRFAFRTFRLGPAAAMATVSGVLLVSIGILYFTLMGPREDTR